MDVALGITAKSLDSAAELAKALHGSRAWGHEQWLGLGPGETLSPAAPGVPAQARLLLSHDYRTAYILLATHASPGDLLRAAAAATAASAEPSTTATAAAAAAASLWPSTATPLQRLQQQHEAAVNVLLLQLFLTCDAVLIALPTGAQSQGCCGGGGLGPGLVGGSGGGPLAGVTEWVARLRLLQGARRALHQVLCGPSKGQGAGLPKPRHLQQQQEGERDRDPRQAGPSDAGAMEGPVQVLRAWCGRPQPPLLCFVSPGDPLLPQYVAASETSPPPPSRPAASRGTSTATPTSTDPRDANWLLRHLFKRCRPVSAASSSSSSASDPWALCSIDPQLLSLQPGPLALSPAQVHAAALSALLGLEEDTVSHGSQSTADNTGAAIGSSSNDLARLQQLVAATAAAADGGNVWRLGADGEGASSRGSAMQAAERVSAEWRSVAAGLYDAAVAAWSEAARQPLDWVPRGLAAAAATPGGRSAPALHSDSSSGRGRTRTTQPAAAAASTADTSSAATQPPQSPLEPVGTWLASAGGGGPLAARLAAELCQAASDAALRSYMYGMPPRYPARVHSAAVSGAVAALVAAAPPGPGVAAAVARLRAACAAEWRGDRRQCSALSVTGRPCTRHVHGLAEPHGSEATVWVSATTSGCGLVALPDTFDLQAANLAPQLDDGARVAVAAPPPSQQATQQPAAAAAASNPASAAGSGRPKAGKKGRPPAPSPTPAADAAAVTATPSLTPAAGDTASLPPAPPSPSPLLPPHSRHLAVAVAQEADGTTRQCVLGPWVTVTRLGPASSYNERRGLTNQPGMYGSTLFPLTLHMELEPGMAAAGPRAGGPASGGKGGQGRGGRGATPTRQQGPGSTGAPGTPDAVGGSDGEGAAVVLDEQSFPSLASAVAKAATRQAGQGGAAGSRRGGKQQQTLGSDKAAAAPATAVAGDSAAVAGRERANLTKVWPHPQGSAVSSDKTGLSEAGGEGGGDGGAAGAGQQRPGAAAAGSRGRRTRGTPGGAAGAGGGAGGLDPTAFPALQGSRDVRKVYVGYEYQTLDGRRFLATPQQLASAAAASSPPASGPGAAFAGGAGAVSGGLQAAAASVSISTQPGDSSKGQKPSRVSVPPAAATTGAAGNAAASYLLQNHVPLYLQAPAGLQADPLAPECKDGAPAWDPTPRRPASLAQLQRIFVVTPPSSSGEPLLAVRPTVQFRIAQAPQLPADAVDTMLLRESQRLQPQEVQQHDGAGAATTTGTSGKSDADQGREGQQRQGATGCGQEGQGLLRSGEMVSGARDAVTVAQVTLARPAVLPPDSLVVVSLLYAYGLPAEWLGWDLRAEGGEGARAAEGRVGEEAAVQSGEAAAGQGAKRLMLGVLLPLVKLDERVPFDAHLLAGSAVFPIPAAQA